MWGSQASFTPSTYKEMLFRKPQDGLWIPQLEKAIFFFYELELGGMEEDQRNNGCKVELFKNLGEGIKGSRNTNRRKS